MSPHVKSQKKKHTHFLFPLQKKMPTADTISSVARLYLVLLTARLGALLPLLLLASHWAGHQWGMTPARLSLGPLFYLLLLTLECALTLYRSWQLWTVVTHVRLLAPARTKRLDVGRHFVPDYLVLQLAVHAVKFICVFLGDSDKPPAATVAAGFVLAIAALLGLLEEAQLFYLLWHQQQAAALRQWTNLQVDLDLNEGRLRSWVLPREGAPWAFQVGPPLESTSSLFSAAGTTAAGDGFD